MATVEFSEIGNNGITRLDGAINNTTTSITVDSVTALTLDNSTTLAYLTIIDVTTYRQDPSTIPEVQEIVKVTSVSGNVCTVVRAQGGTTGKAFSDDDIVELRIPAELLIELQNALTDGTADLNIGGATLTGSIIADADGSSDHTLGRARIGSAATDQMHLSHFDNFNTTSFAIRQSAVGATKVNGKAGQSVIIALNNGSELVLTASKLTTIVDVQVGGDLTVTSTNEVFLNLPTSAGTSGSLWNDSGTVKVAP